MGKTHQHLLKFMLPDGVRLFPGDFRERLAKSEKLPPEFFNYDPETRQPARQLSRKGFHKPTQMEQDSPDALPSIRVVGGRSWVGILSKETHKDLLDRSVPVALDIVQGVCKKPVPVELSRYELGLEVSHFPRSYKIREMVIKKGTRKGMSEAEQFAIIKKRIEQSICRQAIDARLDCPVDEQMGVMVSSIDRPRGLRIITANGVTNQYAQLVDVNFYAHLDLSGFWFAGNLTARGYGRIIPWRQSLARGEEGGEE